MKKQLICPVTRIDKKSVDCMKLVGNTGVVYPLPPITKQPLFTTTEELLDIIRKENTKYLSGNYISDQLIKDINRWPPNGLVFISCPVGSGKTTFVEKICKHYSVLILSNRILNLMQLENRMIKNYSSQYYIKSYQAMTFDEFLDTDEIDMNYDFVMLDECHFFLEDARFNFSNMLVLEKLLRLRRCTRVFLSATGCNIQNFIFQTLVDRMEMNHGFLKNNVIIYEKEKATSNIEKVVAFEDFSAVINKISIGKTIIFVDTIQRGKEIVELLKDNKISCELINSEIVNRPNRKQKELIEEIIQKEKFDSVQCLVTTTVLDCGVNVKDRQVKNIVLFNLFEDSIIQCLGLRRFSVDEKVNIKVFIYNESENELRAKKKKLLQQKDVYQNMEAWVRYPSLRLLNNLKSSGTEFDSFKETCFIDKLHGRFILRFNDLGYFKLIKEIEEIDNLIEGESPAFEKFTKIQKNYLDEIPFEVISTDEELTVSKPTGLSQALNQERIKLFVSRVEMYIGVEIPNDSKDDGSKNVTIRKKFNDEMISIFTRFSDERKGAVVSFKKLNSRFSKRHIPLIFEQLPNNNWILKRKGDK